MKNERGDIKIVIGCLTALIILVVIIGSFIIVPIIRNGNVQEIEIIVKDKYIKGTGKQSQKYLVVDENKNTYEISDLFFWGKWNSTDLYNELEVGKKYKITTSGVRNGFWSWYPNINKIQEIE